MDENPPVFLPAIRNDIREILLWSGERFGSEAADRYGALIRQALHDLRENPTRPGARARPELAPDAYVYHLTYSRDRVAGQRVKRPRHFVLYRFRGEMVEFARLLHDSFDTARHLPPEYQAEEK